MGCLDGRVALVTGAGQGVGRAVALRLAHEGARVVATDLDHERKPRGQGGLQETVERLRATGGEAIALVADVRDQSQLDQAVSAGSDRFGTVDIAIANAGIASASPAWTMSEAQWTDMIDINLSGVWRTCKAVIPSMLDAGSAGSIVVTASTGSVRAFPNLAHYTAAKHGVLGFVKALAAEVAPHSIRVNAVLPTVIDTQMSMSENTLRGLYPHLDEVTREDAAAAYGTVNMLPIPWVEPEDVSNAIVWLCSEQARYITAAAIPVDAGSIEKHMG